jgi:hypothetical protein
VLLTIVHWIVTLDFLTFIWRISVFYSVGSGSGNNPHVVPGQKLTNSGSSNRKNTVDLYTGGMQLYFLVLILFKKKSDFCHLYSPHTLWATSIHCFEQAVSFCKNLQILDK